VVCGLPDRNFDPRLPVVGACPAVAQMTITLIWLGLAAVGVVLFAALGRASKRGDATGSSQLEAEAIRREPPTLNPRTAHPRSGLDELPDMY